MQLSLATLLLVAATGCEGYSFTQPMRVASIIPTRSYTFSMISDGSDRSERQSLDISKTTYSALVKAPKDAYKAFAEKGMSNAKMVGQTK
jgi:hypothetical protein